MDRGYIKLWRKSLDTAIFNNPNAWLFWCYCLMKAAHKKRTVLHGNQTVVLEPGQFIFGRNKASHETGLSEQNIRTCAKVLDAMEYITIKPTNKFSIITVINWDIYQPELNQTNQQSNQQITNKEPTDNHKQECKELKNNTYSRVVEYLNRKTGSNFKPTTKTTQSYIKARLNEGHEPDDFKTVIDYCCSKWATDPKMVDYLRPQTLFSTKFEGYLNAAKRNIIQLPTPKPQSQEDIEKELAEKLA